MEMRVLLFAAVVVLAIAPPVHSTPRYPSRYPFSLRAAKARMEQLLLLRSRQPTTQQRQQQQQQQQSAKATTGTPDTGARLQQEQALYHRLKSLNSSQITRLQTKLPTAVLRRVIARLKLLKRLEENNGNSGKSASASGSAAASGTRSGANKGAAGGSSTTATTSGADGPNMVMSGASSVRSSGSPANSANGKAGSSPGAANPRQAFMNRMRAVAKRMMAMRRRRPKTAMDTFRGYRTFRRESGQATSQGCSYPMAGESMAETFLAGAGGCKMGAAVCYMKGMSCVDVGMSMMCCPLGYSSGTLRMLNRMKQMQSFMNNFM